MSDSYLPGAVVLAISLRDAGTTKKLAVLVTMETLSADTISELKALYDARGVLRATMRNQKGAGHFDEFQERLRRDGLPHTHVLTGD